MALAWKTVRVFVSSTFHDMEAERDFLARTVFPLLRTRLASQRVLLTDVDLRWGISEQDAKAGLTVDICLDEIDSCRPFFIGLLGQRYGTRVGEHSITAQEVYYALLQGYLPRQLSDLRPLLEMPPAGGTPEERECLQSAYRWNPEKGRYLLRPELTETERALLHRVFERAALFQRDRSYFFFRKPALTRLLAKERRADDYIDAKSDHEARRKLAELKKQIRHAGLKPFRYGDLESLGRLVTDTLAQRIESELGGRPVVVDWLQQEDELHESFMVHRTRHFAGRRAWLDRLHAFAERSDGPGLMLLSGAAGCGKSALLAFLAGELRARHPDWLVLPHFVGASPSSTGLRDSLRRWGEHLRRSLTSAVPLPADLPGLLAALPSLLQQSARTRRVVILLDAVNQFDARDNARSLGWLPTPLPEGVRIIASMLPDTSGPAVRRRPVPAEMFRLEDLTPAEARQFAQSYLAEIRREFPNVEVAQAFYAKLAHGHPLYISAALEEVRLFGDFKRLGEKVASLPGDAVGLFQQVIERVETDLAAYPGLVRDFLTLLACLRRPMTPAAIQILLQPHAPRPAAGRAASTRLPDLIWTRLFHAFRFYLFERGGMIDFFHGQFQAAVEQSYLTSVPERKAVHAAIAGFCANWETTPDAQVRAYALRYQPHHLIQAGQWEQLASVLANSSFLKACREERCAPAAAIAETIEAATAGEKPEMAARVQRIVREMLLHPSKESQEVALQTCAELEWLDLLAELAEGDDEFQRVEACAAFFSIYSRRLHHGEPQRAWEGVELLAARVRGRFGLPRRAALSALIGLIVAIFIESSDNPDQMGVLVERVKEIAWAVLPLRRTSSRSLRRLQCWLGRLLLLAVRPGVALGLAALERQTSAVNLKTAKRFFRQSRAEREVLRDYYPYLEPRPRDLQPLARLLRQHCTRRDAFHYNMTSGAIASQGAAQPEPMIRLLSEVAALDDALALYVATRGLYYILCYQRETGRVPSPSYEQQMAEWCVRYYRRPDYELNMEGAKLPRRSLAEHVADYLGHYAPAEATALDRLLNDALEQGKESLQTDLFDALGTAGQQGGYPLVFRLLGPVLQRQQTLASFPRRMLVEALARVYHQYPQPLAEWLQELAGATIQLEEISQYPTPQDSLWRGGNEQILRRILQREPALRAVLHRLLDGLPRARSVAGYLQHVARVLLELVITEEIPANPYAVSPRPAGR